MFAASSQYGRGNGGNYGGDNSGSNGMKNFKTQARSVNIPMTSSIGMQNFGLNEHSSDRDASSIGPISSFSNQQAMFGMNAPAASQVLSAQRDGAFNGQQLGQYQNSSQNPFMDKGSLARMNNAVDTKQKVDGKVRSERFMKELQGILSSQLENIKDGIVRDLKSYKEVDESVKRSMGLSVDSLCESIELLKNDIKNVVKNYARKVEETITDQQSELQEMSKQFSTRVKALFPNLKNSKKKSAQEIEEELDSVLGSLSGEVSALQRELGLIRSQISVDGEFIKDKLESLATKEHEGFKCAAVGQESVQKQILDTIKSCQTTQASSVAQAPANHANKLAEKDVEKMLQRVRKEFQSEMLKYSKANLTLEKDIDKLLHKQALMEQEIKLWRQHASKPNSGLSTPMKSTNREESAKKPSFFQSSTKETGKNSNLESSKKSFWGKDTHGSSRKNFSKDQESGSDDSASEEQPVQSKKMHWKTLERLKREEKESRKAAAVKEPIDEIIHKRTLTIRRLQQADEIALQQIRSQNSRLDYLRAVPNESDSECSEEDDDESNSQNEEKTSLHSKDTRRIVPETPKSKTSTKVQSKNKVQQERESTKKKVSKIAGSAVAEAMESQGAIIEKATRSVRLLRLKAAVS